MLNEFRSLVYSHSSVFVAAAVQLINFPWNRCALDYGIPNDCVWEGDIVFDFARPSHWDTHTFPHLQEAMGLARIAESLTIRSISRRFAWISVPKLMN